MSNAIKAGFVATMTLKLTWRARWQLVPIIIIGVTIIAKPALILAFTTALILGYVFVLKKELIQPFRVSQKEAEVLSIVTGVSSVWSLLSEPLAIGWPVLVFTTSPFIAAWCWSRRIRVPWWSLRWWQLRSRWAALAVKPGAFCGSRIVHGSYQRHAGATSFDVTLAVGVHPDAISENDRLMVETQLTKWRGATSFTTGETTRTVSITICPPVEHLSESVTPTLEPRTDPTEPAVIGTTATGGQLAIDVTMPGGVRHGIIAGATGGGKSHALDLVVRELATTDQIMIIDGGQGSSLSPQLAHATAIATTPEQWLAMIQSVHRISEARRYIDGLDEVTAWNPQRWSPVTLVIDEAPAVAAALTAGAGRLVLDIMRQGRKHGVRVIQVSQDIKHRDLVGGGKDVREQVQAAGFTLLLRPTKSTIEEQGNIPPGLLSALDGTDPNKAGYTMSAIGTRWAKTLGLTHEKEGVTTTQCLPLGDDEQLLMAAPWGSWEQSHRASHEKSGVSRETPPETHETGWSGQESQPKSHTPETETHHPHTRVRAPETPPENETPQEAINRAMGEGCETVAEIMAATGLSRATVYRHRRKQPA